MKISLYLVGGKNRKKVRRQILKDSAGGGGNEAIKKKKWGKIHPYIPNGTTNWLLSKVSPRQREGRQQQRDAPKCSLFHGTKQ